MTIATALAAIILSTIPIALLCLGDPKRRRAAKVKGGMATGRRRWLTVAALLPGLACALAGESAALLMWLGGCALVGWALACGCELTDRRATPR